MDKFNEKDHSISSPFFSKKKHFYETMRFDKFRWETIRQGKSSYILAVSLSSKLIKSYQFFSTYCILSYLIVSCFSIRYDNKGGKTAKTTTFRSYLIVSYRLSFLDVFIRNLLNLIESYHSSWNVSY